MLNLRNKGSVDFGKGSSDDIYLHLTNQGKPIVREQKQAHIFVSGVVGRGSAIVVKSEGNHRKESLVKNQIDV